MSRSRVYWVCLVVIVLGIVASRLIGRRDGVRGEPVASSAASTAREGGAGIAREERPEREGPTSRAAEVAEPAQPEAEPEPTPFEGEGMRLYGRVTNVTGDSIGGIEVSARGSVDGPMWRTVTGADGSYAFERVPRVPLRVTARGALDTTASRVTRGDRDEEEASLVLEPGATLIVRSKVARGRVIVSASGDRERHQDATYEVPASDLPEPSDGLPLAEEEPPWDEAEDAEQDFARRANMIIDSLDRDDVGGPLWTLNEALVRALPDYDPDDPARGITRIIETALEVTPVLEEVFADLAGVRGEGLGRGDVARRVSEVVLAGMPELPVLLAFASVRAREGGEEGFDALLGAVEDEARARWRAQEEAEAAKAAESAAEEEEFDRFFRDLGAKYGGEVYFLMQRGESVDVSGRVDERLRVRPYTRLEVHVMVEETLLGEPLAVRCGEVYLRPGEVHELSCGAGVVTLRGRVVDSQGAPVKGARAATKLIFERGLVDVSAVTDAGGRFVLAGEATMANVWDVEVTGPGDGELWLTGGRNWVACRPGVAVDLGEIVLRKFEDTIAFESEGVDNVRQLLDESWGSVRWVEPDGHPTLDALGIPNGSQLLMIDGEDVTPLSREEVLRRMAADSGESLVWFGIRAPNGDFREVVTARPGIE